MGGKKTTSPSPDSPLEKAAKPFLTWANALIVGKWVALALVPAVFTAGSMVGAYRATTGDALKVQTDAMDAANGARRDAAQVSERQKLSDMRIEVLRQELQEVKTGNTRRDEFERKMNADVAVLLDRTKRIAGE